MKIATATCLLLASLFCVVALADDNSDRSKLKGTWQVDQGNGDTTTWSFTPEGDSLRVKEIEGSNKVVDFVCTTDGKPCEAKVSGKKANVSMWFVGPKLVELETKGFYIIERRFSILSTAGDMQLEVVPMAPNGKTETVTLRRSKVTAGVGKQ
jgi:hypothetical protein